jgi:hypothetical protein
MDEPKKVQESLKQLLLELQKVKNLNNLANEYRTISMDLILSLQDYLKKSNEFSGAFNDYLAQTNQSVQDTKSVLDDVLSSINLTIARFGAVDGSLVEKSVDLQNGLTRLEQHCSHTEDLYKTYQLAASQLKESVEKRLFDATVAFRDGNNDVKQKVESLLTLLSKDIERKNDQLQESITLGDNQLRDDHKLIMNQLAVSQNNVLNGLNQNRAFLLNTISPIEKSFEKQTKHISGKIEKIKSMQSVIMGILVILIILVIYLIFR